MVSQASWVLNFDVDLLLRKRDGDCFLSWLGSGSIIGKTS